MKVQNDSTVQVATINDNSCICGRGGKGTMRRARILFAFIRATASPILFREICSAPGSLVVVQVCPLSSLNRIEKVPIYFPPLCACACVSVCTCACARVYVCRRGNIEIHHVRRGARLVSPCAARNKSSRLKIFSPDLRTARRIKRTRHDKPRIRSS